MFNGFTEFCLCYCIIVFIRAHFLRLIIWVMNPPLNAMKTLHNVIKKNKLPLWYVKYCTSKKFNKSKIRKESSTTKKYCVYLSFDKKTEQTITDLRLVMAHEIEGVKSPLGKMTPHITVGIISTDDRDRLFRNFDKFSERMKKFDIRLENINCFDRRKNRVLFVEPVLNADLEQTLFSFANSFEQSEIGSHYEIDKWNPHCTLAKRLTEKAFSHAKELAEKCWTPVIASTLTVGVVDVMKPTEILRYKLLTDENRLNGVDTVRTQSSNGEQSLVSEN